MSNLTQAQRAALEAAVLDLDAAATPTRSDVFTSCGVHAADLRDAIKAALQPQTGEPKPVAWTHHDQLAMLERSPRQAAMMWGESHGQINRPLFAHPPKPDPDVVRLVEAAKRLLAACEADFGVPDEHDEDDEPVGRGIDTEMAVKFGHLREARAALASFSALGEGE